jgi:hypothetical protein
LKLKGTLISKGYTEIIHIAGGSRALNSFPFHRMKKEVEDFVLDYITNHNYQHHLLLQKTNK